jgi:hypothetical protein
VQSSLSAFLYYWLFRGCERTFRPFHRGVVTTYALENGSAGEGDNRDHSLFAIRAARCSIHEILPIFHPYLGTRTVVPFERYGQIGGCRGSCPGQACSARAAAGSEARTLVIARALSKELDKALRSPPDKGAGWAIRAQA